MAARMNSRGERLYASRSSAHRAARAACRRALGPAFCAYEGPDYEIHPEGIFSPEHFGTEFWYYRLRGPALEESNHD